MCGAPAALGEGSRYHIHFFKEQRPLELDATRVALFRSVSDGVAGVSPSLAPAGLDDSTLTPTAVAAWSLGRLGAATPTPADAERAVADIARLQLADFVSPVFRGEDGGPLIVTPRLLIGFDPAVSRERAEAILAELNAGTVLDRDWAGMSRAYRVQSAARNGFDVLAVANQLAQRPEVRFAEPDMFFTGRSTFIPNDTFFSDCWGLHNTGQAGGVIDADMDAPEAWDLEQGDSSIIVAVLDNGVQLAHPDLNMYPTGFDSTGEAGGGNPVNACDNHGTPVAGCISAIINNSLGVTGVAPGCRSASARPFISTVPCDGSWSSIASWTVDALTWADSIGARVTNNSNGYGFTSSAIAQKYSDTRDAGMVHFASAGNNASSTMTYPSTLPTVNAVAALNRFGGRASFSNFGVGLAFSAPGDDIASTDRTGSGGYVSGDYVIIDGTSFASPYTAGVAALILSVDPTFTALEVEQLLQVSSIDLGAAGYDTNFGWGFVNARRAVEFAITPPTCHFSLPLQADPDGSKARYFSFRNVDSGRQQAMRVIMQDLPPPFDYANGRVMWVGPPIEFSENSGSRLASDLPSAPSFWGSTLQCNQHYTDWSNYGLVQVYGGSVVPGGTYVVQAVDSTCDAGAEISYSNALNQPMSDWGDCVGGFDGVQCVWTEAEGIVSGADILAPLDKFRNRNCAVSKARADTEPSTPDQIINISDVIQNLNAFRSAPYPFSGPPVTNPCP
jgi:subtilisin family serine protease